MKYQLLCLVVLVLFSCKKEEEKKEVSIPKKEIQVNLNDSKEEPEIPDTLKIKYQEHKNLFDILVILPDSTFSSWEWPKDQRIELVNKVKKNSYIVANRFLSKFTLDAPNTLHIQVVDGSWYLSIYKIKPNNYIVITDDLVGGGNSFKAFEYENGELTPISFTDLFDHYLETLVIDPNDEKCMEIFNDSRAFFDYTYIGTKKIKISKSDLEELDCFKGNTLNYEFSPSDKMFYLTNITTTENSSTEN